LPVEIRCSTRVTDIRPERDRRAVDTTAGTFRAKAVIVACGILRFGSTFSLAETLAGQRTIAGTRSRQHRRRWL